MIIINTILNSAKIFGIFMIAQFIFGNINLYQAKYIQPTFKELAKYNFYFLIVYWIMNIVITMTFSYAINKYNLPVWVPNILYWGSAVIPLLILTYLWYGQLPTINQSIGMVFVMIGLVFVVWK